MITVRSDCHCTNRVTYFTLLLLHVVVVIEQMLGAVGSGVVVIFVLDIGKTALFGAGRSRLATSFPGVSSRLLLVASSIVSKVLHNERMKLTSSLNTLGGDAVASAGGAIRGFGGFGGVGAIWDRHGDGSE
jgi:hypothetical protein